MAVSKTRTSELRIRTRKVATVHFLYIFAVAVQLIAFDAAKLIEPKVTMFRWIALSVILSVTTIVWYIARNRSSQPATYKWLILALITSDIAFASFNVYVQRGMASRAVMLYAIPIIVSAVIARKSAIMATALLCIAAYIGTTISYFVLNFNEGYKIELYGEIGFYCAIFIVIAMLLWAIVRPKRHTE